LAIIYSEKPKITIQKIPVKTTRVKYTLGSKIYSLLIPSLQNKDHPSPAGMDDTFYKPSFKKD
jgi:hypothetical protein